MTRRAQRPKVGGRPASVTDLNAFRKRKTGHYPTHAHCAKCGQLNVVCRITGCQEGASQ